MSEAIWLKVLRMNSKTDMTETTVKAVTKFVNELVSGTAVPTTTRDQQQTLSKIAMHHFNLFLSSPLMFSN